MIAGLDSSVGIDSLKRYDATEFLEYPHFFFTIRRRKFQKFYKHMSLDDNISGFSQRFISGPIIFIKVSIDQI